MYPNSNILFNQAVKEVLPSKNDRPNSKIPINYDDFINFIGMFWISQGLLDGDTVSSDVEVFDLKTHPSMVADVFCRLHNDKYTNYSHHNNRVFRAFM
jgi:hypothetical protein